MQGMTSSTGSNNIELINIVLECPGHKKPTQVAPRVCAKRQAHIEQHKSTEVPWNDGPVGDNVLILKETDTKTCFKVTAEHLKQTKCCYGLPKIQIGDDHVRIEKDRVEHI